MRKEIYFTSSLIIILVVFFSGCINQPIGGERDEHGCLGPAGYTWNESVGACVREWELNENQKQAAKMAVDYVGYEYATTIIEVMVARCPGCFVVKLEQGENRDATTVDISNWTAIGKTVTRHTCTEEEKQAEICTMEYVPVCGFKSDGTSKTYGNGCGACADGVEYWEGGECESKSNGKDCVSDEDCVVFGETGDCNCGCFNKDYQWEYTGECFSSAPIDCKCVNGTCEGIFEGDMSYSEARQIAEQSECVEEGNLTEHARFSGTNNWEIDLEPFIEKEGCNPICVVSPIERTAKINWRCTGCAEDGEIFSRVSDKYPDSCCEGLKEWIPIPDTRFSIADVCYEVGSPSESNLGMCIKCGDGLCESHLNYDENPCSCPEDCAGKDKSMFSNIEEFCLSNDWNLSLSKACDDQEDIKDSPICELC